MGTPEHPPRPPRPLAPLFLATLLLAPTPPGTVGKVDRELRGLREALPTLLAASGGRNAEWGILAVSLDRGDTLLSLNPGEVLVPASNVKLFSSAAALHHLGPDFRFRTFLVAMGPIQDGRLMGDLVLFGTGDPSLSERSYPSSGAPLDSLVGGLLRWGITEVEGHLLVDGSFFQGPELHEDWDPSDFNEPFAAPVAALSFNENLVTLRVEAGERVGSPPAVHLLPEGPGVAVANEARTFPRSSTSRIWLQREAPSDPIGIVGEIPVGGRDVWRHLPVGDPMLSAGRHMEAALAARGILLRGEVRVVRDREDSPLSPLSGEASIPPTYPRILATLTSPPLVDLLKVVNKASNNLYAEAVTKALGQVVLGEGSFEGGSRVVQSFLVEEVGVHRGEIRVRDASGLSTGNGVSARGLVSLLDYMARSELWETFWSTLPEAGAPRELARMRNTPAARNLRAKTGTLEGVSALSGMVRTRTGERILFSFLSNGVSSSHRAKRAEDELGVALASLARPAQE